MRAVFVMIMVLMAGCHTAKQGSNNIQATVRSATGEAQVRSAAAEWSPARVGQTLREGDGARTLAGGQLDVQLSPHGGVFSLKEDSAIEVERLGSSADEPNVVAVLNLTRGRIIGDTLKLPKGMKVVVKTRGGTFNIP